MRNRVMNLFCLSAADRRALGYGIAAALLGGQRVRVDFGGWGFHGDHGQGRGSDDEQRKESGFHRFVLPAEVADRSPL